MQWLRGEPQIPSSLSFPVHPRALLSCQRAASWGELTRAFGHSSPLPCRTERDTQKGMGVTPDSLPTTTVTSDKPHLTSWGLSSLFLTKGIILSTSHGGRGD